MTLEIIQNQHDFYIKTNHELDYVIKLIKDRKIVAIDTEFSREITYYPILSIIQVAVRDDSDQKHLFIIDCLTNLKLDKFFAIIADKNIIKILHSASQDLQIFHDKSNLMPQNIFDTQIMANFCGFGFGCGYSRLVNDIFNKEIDKKHQRSNWKKRPLSKKQINYALLDVFYLEEIYQKFIKILNDKNRLQWCKEETTDFIVKTLDPSENHLFKSFAFKNKTDLQVSQLKDLILMREGLAKKLNKPRQHVIKNKILEQIISDNKIDFNFNDVILREIKKILACNVVNQNHLLLNESTTMTLQQKETYNKAKSLINKLSKRENLAEQFLINSATLKKIICASDNIKNYLNKWRYEVLAPEFEKLI